VPEAIATGAGDAPAARREVQAATLLLVTEREDGARR
jgi:hypothetical protein